MLFAFTFLLIAVLESTSRNDEQPELISNSTSECVDCSAEVKE